MKFSKITVEHCCDDTAAWEFPWICNISAKHTSGETNVKSLTLDFASPIRRNLLYDLCLTVGYECIAIMIITDVTPLVF